MLQSRSQRLLFGKKVENIGIFLTNFTHKLEHADAADIFVYTKMHAKRRCFLFHCTVFLYQLFQASNRFSFMINISTVSKNDI